MGEHAAEVAHQAAVGVVPEEEVQRDGLVWLGEVANCQRRCSTGSGEVGAAYAGCATSSRELDCRRGRLVPPDTHADAWLLLLLSLYEQPLNLLLSTEEFSEEIIRTLGSGIGLVLSVPLTTGVAALTVAGAAAGGGLANNEPEETRAKPPGPRRAI